MSAHSTLTRNAPHATAQAPTARPTLPTKPISAHHHTGAAPAVRHGVPGSEAALDALIAAQLTPCVQAIDLEGLYPEAFLRSLGALGGYAHDLAGTIQVMSRVGETCLSSAFAVWCQTACARYLRLSDNAALHASGVLDELVSARLLGGTGLSNTFKSCCEIERFLLSARRVDGGYEINGNLPWVSNLGPDHVFVTGCPLQDDGRLVFFLVRCDQPGFRLQSGVHFAALEGTRTLACQFRGVHIPDAQVLAHADASAAFLARIQPGMILAQMGMGLGLVHDCIGLVEGAARTHSHVNQYLDDQPDALRSALDAARTETLRLAAWADTLPTGAEQAELMTEVLRVRLAGSELALRAAQAAMLHQGARGYLRQASAQRRLREAYFVAIVTPSIKHLRRELARRGADLKLYPGGNM